MQGVLALLVIFIFIAVEIFEWRREKSTDDYEEYLKSKHWQKVKRRFFSDPSRKKCAVCGIKHNLDLHHKTYENLGHEKLDDLIPLCRAHHELVHEYLDKAKELGLSYNTDDIVRKYRNRLRKYQGPPTIPWKISSKLNIPY